LDSTNSLALSLGSDPANEGLVLLTQEQTSGRGQYGHTWTAPPGSSVLLTALLFPPPFLRPPAILTALAAVSVCETILELTGLQAKIKWPNDVLVSGKKVCGILIEQRNTGNIEFPLTAAVGIGLNVRQPAEFFAQANLPLGGSLASLSGFVLETRLVAERLIENLDLAYDRLLSGDTKTLEGLWKDRLGIIGQRVIVEMAHEEKEGRVLDVTWEGIDLKESSRIVRIRPEQVRHVLTLPPP